ncbi:envelope stress response protein PspG [Pantoea sp. B9002]|uniref:envelope stress response protein PspG n=1 Tax=Pantoea TaxID=53335 RepID=UPI00077BBA01|nr:MULTISPECIES: envelope stress response protein PspG [unclassified Pantoea]MBY4889364.1 envelope stress response protein PspG [Pantoea sp. DY-15]MDR6352098.1 phage shock protein G [Pantoea sp. SORGH_AS_0659]NWA59452.1 envelope stress response protein PspG [Pantoea sp. B9002]PYG46647.1 phage shock protein G [Pantoea sp. AG1095]
MEILFVIGFFLMLLFTGVSLLGVIAALVVATALMFFGGLLAIVIKVLPWLVLAVVAVWLYRAFTTPSGEAKLRRLKRKISDLDRRDWR